jgi:hypothetical protein
VLLSDLESMRAYMFDYDREEMKGDDGEGMKGWYRFMRTLLHPRLLKLDVPTSCYPVHWDKNKDASEMEKLLAEVGEKCSALTSIEIECGFSSEFALQEGSWFARAFFGALPHLSSLQVIVLYFFELEDWALQQFGMHVPTLV